MKKPVPIDQLGIPLFPCSAEVLLPKKILKENKLRLFDLSSHHRAKEAIKFGLKMRKKNFHIFVIGENRSGCVSTTMSYLNEYIKKLPPPFDWVYVNNFVESHKPIPFKLPQGLGIQLRDQTTELLQDINTVIRKIFTSSQFRKQADSLSNALQSQIDQQTKDLQKLAKTKGYELINGEGGLLLENAENKNETTEAGGSAEKDLSLLRSSMARLNTSVNLANQKIEKQIQHLKQNTARDLIKPLFSSYKEYFGIHLKSWIDDLKRDVLQNLNLFFDEEDPKAKLSKQAIERYTINLMVDHSQSKNAQVVLESDPTYENLFGSIKYRHNQSTGGLETNFTLIRPGSLHLANGGILVLRAYEISKYEDAWDMLKAALRDNKITIREKYRENATQLDDAPSPISIPLDLQVFLITSPLLYYSFLQQDPEFSAHFKIRAEIDPNFPVTPENITIYQKLIRTTCLQETERDITPTAISHLTGYSSRWAKDRQKLSARFEYINDILDEADAIASENSSKKPIDEIIIEKVLEQRRYRNSFFEDSIIEDFHRNQILISTHGFKVGLVNGLTVFSIGDQGFGMPSLISARTYIGEEGVINIEMLTEQGGPIQQKGALILEGFLNGVFAQKYPLSCSCSLTFEQNYNDVEGDSASMAELIAILSSLANVPIRQDLAITGSINQFGNAQAVGGIHWKIEGFHRLCKERGFTKTQGVIIPNTNICNLTLRPDVVEDIRNGDFHIWGVDTVYEAIELITGIKAGVKINANGQITGSFEKESIFALAAQTLKTFDNLLKSRS
ncbi:MAG: ATP-binding protein [Proteobacteria bacterium]|nr:ATP-binding protein [Pseudomonadota bacterium]